MRSTKTSIEIQWNSPLNDGGCPIIDYDFYRSDNTALSTLIEDGVSTLNYKPYITNYEATGLT